MNRHWLSRERLALYSGAALFLALATGLLLWLRFPHGVDAQGYPLTPDFIVFWSASKLALSGTPAAAYDLAAITAVQHVAIAGADQANNAWLYPPTFYLLILPLALLPYLAAYLLFMGAGLAALAAVVRGICRSQGLPWRDALLPLLGFPAVFINLYAGQNGLLTAALAGAALLCLERRPLLAGLLVAGLTIKPQLGLLWPLVLVCGRHWRALAGAVAGTLLFGALSLAVLGNDTLQAFLAKLPALRQALAGDSLLLVRELTSFYSLGRLLGLPGSAAALLHAAVALTVAAAVAWVWLRRCDFALRAAALLAGSLLISPYLFDYDQGLLAPALAWFTAHAGRRGCRGGEQAAMAAAWLMPVLWIPLYHFTGLQLTPLAVLAFFLMILRRAAADEPAAA